MAPYPSYTQKWHSTPYASIAPTRPELSLSGKTAVITGGGAGIGLAISITLAQASISKLAIIGRRTSVLAAAKSQILALPGNKTEVFIVSADIANQTQVNDAFAKITAEFGKPLDILVSNAGYFSGPREFGTETEEEWNTIMNINIKGVYFITTAFAVHAAKDATIIGISTAIAHLSPFPGFTSYAATKLAGSKIMEYFQSAHPEFRVVDVHPGQVRETEMSAKVGSKGAHVDDAELAGQFVVWAASAEAGFLKGKFVWCNWDVDELKANAKEIESTSVMTIGMDGFSAFK